MLPVVVIALLPAAIIPMILPPMMLPVVVIIPEPVFNVPDTLTPVPVIVSVVLPTAAIVTFPFAVAIFTLEFPLLMPPVNIPVN